MPGRQERSPMGRADPIVLIPGFMGSRLSRVRDNQVIWIDPVWALQKLPTFVRDLMLRGPDDPKLYPSGVLHDVDIGDLVRIGVYRRLWQFALRPDGLGLTPGEFHEFAFDWRKGVSAAAEELDAMLGGLPDPGRPVTLIAHSQGGLVAARLFQLGGPGSNRVGRLVAVGCPFAGLLKTLTMIAEHSGVLADILPHDPIRALLAGMPGTYELMPSRTEPELFTDGSGRASTPYACGQDLAAAGCNVGLLDTARQVATSLPLTFPVPVRLVQGYGVPTALKGTLVGGLSIAQGLEGDGQCPAVSLLAAQGRATDTGPARVVFSVPFGEHVHLVSHDAVLQFLAEDLVGRSAPAARVVADVRFRLAVPGHENLLVVETRDAAGGPLGTGAPRATLSGFGELLLTPCPVEGAARWLGRFPHPSTIATLSVTIAGLDAPLQPRPIHLFP
jgi:pimeloyl-ACP methyl ester carboxylesterase